MLSEHPGVEAVAVTATVDRQGDRQLLAYVVPKGETVPAGELRSFLRQRLPDYMVPSGFVPLKALPLSANGKVDRGALPVPPARSQLQGAWVAPGTALEKDLATIWAAVLRVEPVGAEDNFFRLGGHSLLAAQVISRLRTTFGVELPLRVIFEDPTVRGLARRLESALEAGASSPTVPLVALPRSRR